MLLKLAITWLVLGAALWVLYRAGKANHSHEGGVDGGAVRRCWFCPNVEGCADGESHCTTQEDPK